MTSQVGKEGMPPLLDAQVEIIEEKELLGGAPERSRRLGISLGNQVMTEERGHALLPDLRDRNGVPSILLVLAQTTVLGSVIVC